MGIIFKLANINNVMALFLFIQSAECHTEPANDPNKFCAAADTLNTSAVPSNGSSTQCHLHALHEENVYGHVTRLLTSGMKLIEYNLSFPYYDTDPLDVNTDMSYKAYIWTRTATKHGETLLSLPFNYNILSLSLLSFGVERLTVNITDSPTCCFSTLSEEEKLLELRTLLGNDFRAHSEEPIFVEERDKICHQVIREKENTVSFEYECCRLTRNAVKLKCDVMPTNEWVSYLYRFIDFMDIVFFLFGPLIAQRAFAKRSFRVTQYVVNLMEPHKCKLRKHVLHPESELRTDEAETCFGGIREEFETVTSEDEPALEQGIQTGAGYMYSKGVTELPADTPTDVSMPTLYIQVDHKFLMSEKDVSVGPFKFLWDHLVLCRIRRYHPFINCCKQSIFGSWSGKFFCAIIPEQNRFAKFCSMQNSATCCSWKNIFRFLGLLGALCIVTLPVIGRLLLYGAFEKQEYDMRRKAVESHDLLGSRDLSLDSQTVFNLSQDSVNILLFVSFITYSVSTFLLIIVYRMDKIRFTEYIINILQDLKHIKRLECFRLYLLHVVMPFEKFGILGLFVAIPYLAVMLPVITCIVIFYCVPTIYLLGRFLFPKKPDWLDKILCCDPKTKNGNYYDTLDRMFLLRYISPSPEHLLPVKPLDKDGRWASRARSQYTWRYRVILGLLLSAAMLSVLALYAECFRYVIEMATLTLMGAMANAGSAGQYFMLSFFLVTYTIQVLNNLTEKYQTLLSRIFSHIKGKLDTSALEVIKMRGSEQQNVAFKFFSEREINELITKRQHFSNKKRDVEATGSKSTQPAYMDRFEIYKRTLHWNLRSLVFFIDKNDNPRIPKKLFDQISALRLSGTPGPVHMNILIALRQLFYMLVFLFFVIVVVLAFGDAYNISTTNQLLLTLVGGLVPFIVLRVMKPKGVALDLNTYSFQGKIHEIIQQFTQSWPVFDLSFDVDFDSDDVRPDVDSPMASDNREVITPRTTEALSTRYEESATPNIAMMHVPESHIVRTGRGSTYAERVKGIQLEEDGANLTLDVEYVTGRQNDRPDNCTIS